MNPSQSPAEIRRQFKLALASGEQPNVEQFVAGLSEESRAELTRDLLQLQADYEHQLLETMEVATDSNVHTSASNDSTRGGERTIEHSIGESSSHNNEDKPPAYVGRYEVGRPIGRGGFGSVYLGWDPQLEREVAIKIPRFRERDPEILKQRIAAFLAEARAAVQLERHSGIVPVYDAGMADDDCYIISQYVAGGSLNERPHETSVGLVEKLRFMATLADTIAFAHDRGWVHRDIKPSNILVDHEGKPFLTDFGLTLRAEDMGKAALIEGTPKYMAPEQARAARAAIQGESIDIKIDHRSDIYSLGVVMYGMLTGKAPHAATGLTDLLTEVIDEPIAPPHELSGDIPVGVGRICMRALEKDPGDRYQSATVFRDQLLAQAQAVESAALPEFNEKQTSGAAMAVIFACGVLLLLLAGFGFWMISGSRDTFIAPGESNDQNTVAMVSDAAESKETNNESQAPTNQADEIHSANPRADKTPIADTQGDQPVATRDPVTKRAFATPGFGSPGGSENERGEYDSFGAPQSRSVERLGLRDTGQSGPFEFRLNQAFKRAEYEKILAEKPLTQGSENSLEVRRARLGLLLADPVAPLPEISLAVENLKEVAGTDLEAMKLIQQAEAKLHPDQAPRNNIPAVIDD